MSILCGECCTDFEPMTDSYTCPVCGAENYPDQLTNEEAEAVYDAAPSVPMSEERINEIVEYATRAWECERCGATYAEYVNGCPKCATGETGGSAKVVCRTGG